MGRTAKIGLLQVVADFDPERDITFCPATRLPFHPNALRFHLHGANEWHQVTYYSPGGGFVVRDDGTGHPMAATTPGQSVLHPFSTGQELLDYCLANNLDAAQVMMADEVSAGRTAEAVTAGLDAIWQVMNQSIETGCSPPTSQSSSPTPPCRAGSACAAGRRGCCINCRGKAPTPIRWRA